ncbi:hypothetical protein [Methylobacterium nodulans]|uniref:Uncharacterized protein n=1 Tax=Methylobacterium nodulans (strain LMG 21967 / CNCM I-2342 / ORS 2060) TaxID=460265 RepID=B8IDN1_METNO|nr:hypothetical protein [Methylobacterium nodulans]ACL55603.1 hypothetical protein Mnod_0566 [Methylobacterium nodulans ORS 2060]
MDRSISPGAAIVLDFIGQTEAPNGYGTIYANGQAKLGIDITTWTLDQVEAEQPAWTRRFGSSACGRYQFMRDTLDKPGTIQDIEGEMGLTGRELFSPDLQDRMAMHLLRRRGWDSFIAGRLTMAGFALSLAKEWASLPVLATTKGRKRTVMRGQSYYAGDGRNRALVSADTVEAMLARALAAERSNPGQNSPGGKSLPDKAPPPLVADADVSPSKVAQPAPSGGLSSGPTLSTAPAPTVAPWWRRALAWLSA